jgi:predicted Zn-dependent protease
MSKSCAHRPGATPVARRNLLAVLASGAVLVACSENVTGRSQFAVVPDEALVQMADQAWSDLKSQSGVSADAAQQERLARVGRKIVAASGREDLEWEFVVFDRLRSTPSCCPTAKSGRSRA